MSYPKNYYLIYLLFFCCHQSSYLFDTSLLFWANLRILSPPTFLVMCQRYFNFCKRYLSNPVQISPLTAHLPSPKSTIVGTPTSAPSVSSYCSPQTSHSFHHIQNPFICHLTYPFYSKHLPVTPHLKWL